MPTQPQEAAAFLWQHWQGGTVCQSLPPALKPTTRAQGYAIQAALAAQAGSPPVGWKIAATNVAGQHHIGVDGPLAGRLFESLLRSDGAEVAVATNRMRVAEPEFAFRMAADLPPRSAPYTQDEVMDAVGELRLTLELPDSRYADFASQGGPSLIAECACASLLVVGPPVAADWRRLDLSQHAVVGTVQGRYVREGSGGAVLGDPRNALTWIANELSDHGVGLRAGELVTTGTSMVPLTVEPGDLVLADFGPLGTVSVQIAA